MRSFSNQLLEQWAADVQVNLNASSTAKLFTNNATVSPTNNVATFTEANWDSYSAVDLAGQWSDPEKSADGVYSILSGEFQFTSPISDLPVDVRGVYVVADDLLIAARRFQDPYTFAKDFPALSMKFIVRVAAAGYIDAQ